MHRTLLLARLGIVATFAVAGCQSHIGRGPVRFSPFQAHYDRYLNTRGTPGAFAISPEGLVATYTFCTSREGCVRAVSQALALCRQRTRKECFIYDIGGRVAWRGQQETQPSGEAGRIRLPVPPSIPREATRPRQAPN